jgi:SagB-type dehydrogenase family enzyme
VTPVEYHERTKHHVNRFARSLGHLDWASQPAPFRAFSGAELYLFPRGMPPGASLRHPPYDQLYQRPGPTGPPTAAAIGDSLRHALGLSAWKTFGAARWALRVNPSSGNLHPTEAYIVTGPAPGLADVAGVYHYAPDRHALELRCRFDPSGWRDYAGGADWLVVLTSIHWREAWKYGERAFRYCQHDLGHAIAALGLAAVLEGRAMRLVPEWPQAAIGALAGVDRQSDYGAAEPEEPGCLLAVGGAGALESRPPDQRLLDAVGRGEWTGEASRLSEQHVDWTVIDAVAAATRDPGHQAVPPESDATYGAATDVAPARSARAIMLQRRSAVAFDGRTPIVRARFLGMLGRTLPGPHPPWDALWWPPRVHLVLFVHRVQDLEPGLYMFPRDPAAVPGLRHAIGSALDWTRADDRLPLFRLASGDCRRLAGHVSCDQDIASDGCVSLGMLADFTGLDDFGPSFYRHLFWESGVIGQVLYLEAEAAGVRGTGIGCFFDDLVHEILGLRTTAYQSVYHFTIGHPVEDARLGTEPGYAWEAWNAG